jgi:hypothetical protein
MNASYTLFYNAFKNAKSTRKFLVHEMRWISTIIKYLEINYNNAFLHCLVLVGEAQFVFFFHNSVFFSPFT